MGIYEGLRRKRGFCHDKNIEDRHARKVQVEDTATNRFRGKVAPGGLPSRVQEVNQEHPGRW